MKTLILCVDRDDDLGQKAAVETPIVGRRRTLEAAMALGVADPEDSDTNALLAAVRMYDDELERGGPRGHQVEVAAISGHRIVGLRSDRALARQLDEVLELTRPDEVVLVSDGAEDEQILPILQSRVRVAHVKRSIVKQAPRLEGFYHVLMRMLDDDKFAKRYVLPLGLILMVWGVAFLFKVENYAWGTTFSIMGAWFLVHAMRWEDRMARFFRDLGEQMRTGKVTLLANLIMLVLLAVGVVQAWALVPSGAASPWLKTLYFSQEFLLYFVSALLVRTAGVLFDGWIRGGRTPLGQWTTAFTLIAFGFIGSVVIELSIRLLEDDSLASILGFDLVLRLIAGLGVAMGGYILARYVKGFLEEPQKV